MAIGPSRATFNRAQSRASPLSTIITIQGDEAIVADFLANAAMVGPASRGIVSFAGDALTEVAKEIHRPHIRTSETFNSIGKANVGSPDGVTVDGGVYSTDVGPETLAGRLLEFGFVHRDTGKFIQYPFMLPAADVIEPIFVNAAVQMVEVLSSRRSFTNPIALAGGSAALDSVRTLLYSFSKFAGDLKVVGVDSSALNKARGVALSGARATGDIESVVRGAIGTRIERRVVGHFASGGIRASVSAQVSGPSSSFSAASQRIYNRVAGGFAGRGLDDLP